MYDNNNRTTNSHAVPGRIHQDYTSSRPYKLVGVISRRLPKFEIEMGPHEWGPLPVVCVLDRGVGDS